MTGSGGTLLADRVVEGDPRACARLISLVEDDEPEGRRILRELPGGQALRVGVTGPPGAGKSTVIDGLIRQLRARELKVAVLAVDPSSPFSGGALLGDRIRMQGHARDRGVYIRSMGSRGQLGGLSAATEGACRVLEAAGFGVILIETVGVGQSEMAIRGVADLVVLVMHPESGDGIQALKAGILEVPDLFVVNKADLPGARATRQALVAMLEEAASLGHVMSPEAPDEQVLLVQGEDPEGPQGVQSLVERLLAARDGQRPGRGRDHLALVRALVEARVGRILKQVPPPADLIDPWAAARHWLAAALPHLEDPGRP
ncbi:MAG: methylmalonyl Co-A mutase-associated GTPase MeaB [Candidatus Sericytochromatia bacterium]|nr:methylmalonyl Co-A mutase-associated GTPase MeaB [Candidatus Sericytochromatia bacterium]